MEFSDLFISWQMHPDVRRVRALSTIERVVTAVALETCIYALDALVRICEMAITEEGGSGSGHPELIACLSTTEPQCPHPSRRYIVTGNELIRRAPLC